MHDESHDPMQPESQELVHADCQQAKRDERRETKHARTAVSSRVCGVGAGGAGLLTSHEEPRPHELSHEKIQPLSQPPMQPESQLPVQLPSHEPIPAQPSQDEKHRPPSQLPVHALSQLPVQPLSQPPVQMPPVSHEPIQPESHEPVQSESQDDVQPESQDVVRTPTVVAWQATLQAPSTMLHAVVQAGDGDGDGHGRRGG